MVKADLGVLILESHKIVNRQNNRHPRQMFLQQVSTTYKYTMQLVIQHVVAYDTQQEEPNPK